MPTLVTVGAQFQILATATDPEGAALTYAWTQVYGPAPAVFSSTSVLQPDLTCPQLGAYRFRLTVSDRTSSSYSDISIIAQGAGSELVRYVDLDTPFVIEATATDSELNPPPDTLAYLWTHVDGPDAITIDEVTDLEPTVTLGDIGEYIVGVRAYDGEDYAYDEITLSTVCPVGTGSTIWSDTFDQMEVGFPELIEGQCFGLEGDLYITDAAAWDTFDSYSVGSLDTIDDPVNGGITLSAGTLFLWYLEGYGFDLFDGYPVGAVEDLDNGLAVNGSLLSFPSFGPGQLYL